MDKIKVFFDQLIDASTAEKPVWNQEAILENKPPHWSYIDGCMALAVQYMHQATGDDKYAEFLDEFIDYYIDEEGNILGYSFTDYNCDNINEGKVLFQLYQLTGKEKYKKALDKLAKQLNYQPRLTIGNYWHKLIYPNQIWLDGLYMVQPFRLQYEQQFNDSKNIEDILNQFKSVKALMFDDETGLPYHGYDEAHELFWSNPDTGLSANFWSRSIGWYMMALVDLLEISDVKNKALNAELRQQLNEIATAILNYQDEATKMFYQVTVKGNQEGNYLETSSSCAIAYSLMKGARLGVLTDDYYQEGEDILRGVVNHQLVETATGFELQGICLVAGLGGMPGKGDYKVRDGSYAYYISEPVVSNDAKGIGPIAYAYSEYLKHQV